MSRGNQGFSVYWVRKMSWETPSFIFLSTLYMDPATLTPIIEALIFVSDQPINASAIVQAINLQQEASGEPLVTEADVQPALGQLVKKYAEETFPFEIKAVSGGYQFYTKPAFHPYLKQAALQKHKKRLTKAALETLAIVAYRQPITKAEVEFIRGVNCDYAIQKLLDRKLLSILGRSDAVGRPLLYGTSPFFMEYFGLNDVSDLPKLKEFAALAEDHLEMFRQQLPENTVPSPAEAETDTPVDHGETSQTQEA